MEDTDLSTEIKTSENFRSAPTTKVKDEFSTSCSTFRPQCERSVSEMMRRYKTPNLNLFRKT